MDFKDYMDYIVNSHMFERVIVNHVLYDYDLDNVTQTRYLNHYELEKITLSFALEPELAFFNPFSILAHKMFLEQISGQRVANHLSESHINEFNLKIGQFIGSSLTLRRNNMYDFLKRWVFLNQSEVYNLRGFVESHQIKGKSFSMGLTNIDAFEPVYSTFEKWALLPDQHKYGIYINIINNYEYPSLNEVFLSHLGLLVL